MLSLRFSAKRFFSSTVTVKNSKPVSSCPAGTLLNLQIKKNGKESVALEDSEYPSWLWTVLDPKFQMSKLDNDPIAKRKKQLRKTNRANIKQNNFLAKI